MGEEGCEACGVKSAVLGWGYLRVKETDTVTKLQIPVMAYDKDSKHADRNRAIHLAERRYYEFLNKYFKNYDVLLFEMLGGERLGAEKNRKLKTMKQSMKKISWMVYGRSTR